MIKQIIDLPVTDATRVVPLAPTGASDRVYVYRWRFHDRKGQHCLVLARGSMNSCLLRFDDGYTMVTSRNALKKWQLPAPDRQPLLETRKMLEPLRRTDNPRRQAARVLVQAIDEALQTPGAHAEVEREMRANFKRFENPAMSADSLPMKTPQEIAAILGLGDHS